MTEIVNKIITNLDHILAHCHRRKYPAKSTIIYAGDESDALYYILKGSVTVMIEDDDGREMIMAYLNEGFQKLTDPEGLPASKAPWGTLTAIDLKRADILWRIPLGDYPELLAQGQSGYGSENYGGPIVTGGDLLFIAATPDQMIKAYNKHNGEMLWQARLPAAGFATPITYAVEGRQYLVVAAGGGEVGPA